MSKTDFLKTDERAAEILAPLRSLAPEMDTFGRIPVTGLLEVHMDPPGPSPAVGDHSALGQLDRAGVEAFLAAAGRGVDSGLLFAELRHLGGAFSRPAAGGGAIASVPGEYGLLCLGIAPTPQAAVAARAAAFAVVRAMARWSRPGLVATFTEKAVDPSRFYDGEDWAALCRIGDEVDPQRVFAANHAL